MFWLELAGAAGARLDSSWRSCIFEDRYFLALAHWRALGDEKLDHPSSFGRNNRNLHLHGFKNHDRVVGLQRIARLHHDLPHRARDLGSNRLCRHVDSLKKPATTRVGKINILDIKIVDNMNVEDYRDRNGAMTRRTAAPRRQALPLNRR